jgi:hypothetical protein
MTKMSPLAAALLFVFASAAYAQASAPAAPPPKPITGQGAATTVETNPAATESKGKADKGLSTAETNITKPKHHKGSKAKGMEEKAEKGGEKMERPERPTLPEHPSR